MSDYLITIKKRAELVRSDRLHDEGTIADDYDWLIRENERMSAELELERITVADKVGRQIMDLTAEVERLRTGWDRDVEWANKLLDERDEARAEVERLREEAAEREDTLAKWIKADEAHVKEIIDLRKDSAEHLADSIRYREELSDTTMRLGRAEADRDAHMAEVERLTDANERLQGMVEWMFEVIVDARDACQRAERTRLAADLREQAELARTSPNGRHPDLRVMTHAAALLWAADRIDPRWTVGDE